MLGHQFAYSAAPVRKVREVQFGILSPEEIVRISIVFRPIQPVSDRQRQKAYSVAKIEHPEVMDETTHKPKVGGLMDPRMGTIDRNFKCQTCGEGMSECPGHFGHIELARPVFHPGEWCPSCKFYCNSTARAFPGFIVKVKKILECICVNCGRLKADSVSGLFFPPLVSHPTAQIFWGLSPVQWRTPNPLCVCSRQSRRSSIRDEDHARFRSLDRRGVRCVRPVLVGHAVAR